MKTIVKKTVKSAARGIAGALESLADWIEDNPEAAKIGIMIGGTLLGFGASKAQRIRQRNIRLKQEHRLYYDYKRHLWLELKRPARPWEREVIKERIRRGDSLYDIYYDLGILK